MPRVSSPVLVAYASPHGSTREVAEAVGEALRSGGAEVDVHEVTDVADVEPYGSVVLGMPLYAGRFPRSARRFLRRHRGALAERPVAVFALGPLKDTEEQWKGSRQQLDKALARVSWLEPVAVELFGGAVDPAKLRFPVNRMEAGDIRDWDRIRGWARGLTEPIHAE